MDIRNYVQYIARPPYFLFFTFLGSKDSSYARLARLARPPVLWSAYRARALVAVAGPRLAAAGLAGWVWGSGWVAP